jgi:hypothetical protein
MTLAFRKGGSMGEAKEESSGGMFSEKKKTQIDLGYLFLFSRTVTIGKNTIPTLIPITTTTTTTPSIKGITSILSLFNSKLRRLRQ